jgi:hypothetical protein
MLAERAAARVCGAAGPSLLRETRRAVVAVDDRRRPSTRFRPRPIDEGARAGRGLRARRRARRRRGRHREVAPRTRRRTPRVAHTTQDGGVSAPARGPSTAPGRVCLATQSQRVERRGQRDGPDLGSLGEPGRRGALGGRARAGRAAMRTHDESVSAHVHVFDAEARGGERVSNRYAAARSKGKEALREERQGTPKSAPRFGNPRGHGWPHGPAPSGCSCHAKGAALMRRVLGRMESGSECNPSGRELRPLPLA